MRGNIRLVYSLPIYCLILLSTWNHPIAWSAKENFVDEPKRILVLYSYNFNQPAQQQIADGLESARKFANIYSSDFLHEYLDISPPRNVEQRSILRQLLLNKYAGQRFDMIITVFNDALNFLMNEGKELSPESPCLALYASERMNLERAGKPVLQSPLYFDVLGTLDLALRLFPQTHRILFVSGKNSLDMAFEDKARVDFASWTGKIEFEYTSNRSLDEVLERVARLPSGTIVIYARISSDITGRNFISTDVAAMLARASSVPVFCLATSQLDTGVVGGSMVDVEALGAMLGRVLPSMGEKEPLAIEPASHFIKPMVNWQQIERWGVSASRLPADCFIINRPPTLWNQYKKSVIAAMLVFSVLLFFIVALTIQNGRRALAEIMARESEARYRVLIEHAPDAIVVYDGDLNRLVDVNPRAEKLFGCSHDELRKSDLFRFYPPAQPDNRDVAVSVAEHISETYTGKAVQFERTVRGADGRETVCEVHLVRLPSEKSRLIRASYIDITERKRTEEALRQSEERYRSILWIAMDGFWLADMEGLLLEVNEAYCQMSGYSADELRTMRISDVEAMEIPEETAERARTIMNRGRVRFESRHRHKDGRLFDVEVSAVYRESGEGQVACFIRDISERKRAEEEREKLQEQLMQAQKMECVGRLAGGVAHDFNNMLGVILGHTDLAMEKMKMGKPLHADLIAIRNATERSADLTRQLLAFARKQTVSPLVIDMNATVEGMLKMLRRLIGEDIDLAWLPGKDVWPVKIDPGQVDQLMVNLCVNARDAIAGPGKITIETANTAFDAEYCASHLDFVPGKYVLLVVSDNGCGMDRETRAKIFEPFFTTKGVGQGTGLGLATVYGIVKQNNGFINVYSEPDQGTTFKIYLPCHAGKDEPMEKQTAAAISTGGQETILLVEDELSVLTMTTTMLERQGYTVLAAATPGEALTLAERKAGKIRLLVTDVVMPEMNGRDLAKRLMFQNPGLRCLFMSGYTANVIAHHGVLDKNIRFIQKPFSKNDLAAKVREALDDKNE